MNEEYEIIKVEIGKMELKENDYLVLRFPEKSIEPDAAVRFIEAIRKSFPELYKRIIAFIGDVEISVISEEEKVLK